MTKRTDKKITIKNCQGCTKIFYFDENVYPNKKYCNRDCYLKFVSRPMPRRSLLSYLSKWKFWVIIVICFYNISQIELLPPMILYKRLFFLKGPEYACNDVDVFYIQQGDDQLDKI